MRGVKRKVSDSEIIGGIKKQRNGGDPDQKTNDYKMLCILSNMSVNQAIMRNISTNHLL